MSRFSSTICSIPPKESHPGEYHWEAGTIKIRDKQVQYNRYDRPRLENKNKSKVNY